MTDRHITADDLCPLPDDPAELCATARVSVAILEGLGRNPQVPPVAAYALRGASRLVDALERKLRQAMKEARP